MPRPAVFIDRALIDPVAAAESLRRLREAGYAIVVASNETRVASGEIDEQAVSESDRDLAARIAAIANGPVIDRFYWCPFTPTAAVDRYRSEHGWRKPRPGMLLQAAEDLELDLAASWMIAGGDDDVAAARAAGCRIASVARLAPVLAVGDENSATTAALDEAVAVVLSGRVRSTTGLDEAVSPTENKSTVETSNDRVVEVFAEQNEPETASIERSPAPATPVRDRSLDAIPADRFRAATVARPSQLHGRSEAEPVREPTAAPPAPRGETSRPRSEESPLAAAMRDLAEELRLHRQAARDLTGGKLLAIVLQLGVLFAAVMGLVHLADSANFLRWFAGAALLQLTAIALLLFDRR